MIPHQPENDMSKQAQIQQRADDIFANADWREGQNIASGLKLSTKEMFNRALEQAENEILDDQPLGSMDRGYY